MWSGPTRHGLPAVSTAPPSWVEALPQTWHTADLSAGQAGWLHAEVMFEHLLMTADDDKATLSGLFDFEPSWFAPVHSEFAAVAFFDAETG